MIAFKEFFRKLTEFEPHDWQIELASENTCTNRLIRIPTGFGKTTGVLGSWLWHRLVNDNDDWPRRLIWCLPMRVLVEQTDHEVRKALAVKGLLWQGGAHNGKVGVHMLMGGVDSGEWHLYPEHCAVLIGTQDMLLSRVMNRGYASPRARWPMEFGLLNQDCLWVMDEVQLMGVGLATSFQLQAFRDSDSAAGRELRPCRTWWMSATLQSDWVRKSPDTQDMADMLKHFEIKGINRKGHLWDDVSKSCCIEDITDETQLADLVCREYKNNNGPALIVVNTVDRAIKLFHALREQEVIKNSGVDIRLIHSRYRSAERSSWREAFLNRKVCNPGTNRIIVATQVVEAGVDISASLLITDLAPWASLVQRFGRCARWGGNAMVIVVDQSPKDDKAAAPYTKDEIDAAREAVKFLSDVAPLHLEAFEQSHTDLLPRLYPFDPLHLLLRHELEELFDTTPDLSGADIDISRFIRSGEERDLHVFWADLSGKSGIPAPDLQPSWNAMCAVPFLKARDWLCGSENKTNKKPRLKEKMRAWVWDWLDGAWRKTERRDLYPGRTVLVAADCGGYLPDIGWAPDSREAVTPVTLLKPKAEELSDSRQESEALSLFQWQTIAVHGRETGKIAREIAGVLAPAYADLFEFAGRWHDAGKAHPAFNNSIRGEDRPDRRDLAKAPQEAWLPVKKLYPMEGEARRAGFRHELVGVLSLFAVLQRRNPDHEALLGPWRELLAATGFQPKPAPSREMSANPVEQDVLDLDSGQFNLIAYLICAHHGKVRLAWHSSPADQGANDDRIRILGLKNGDQVPAMALADSQGNIHELPEFDIDLSVAAAGLNPVTGMGWTERVLKLMEAYGPFALAWMEALLRVADQRASRLQINDELLNPEEQS